MEQEIKWFQEQMESRRFRWLLVGAVAAGVGLTAEFFVFSYSILKIFRYLLLYAALFFLAWIDHKQKRIPNKILSRLLVLRAILLVAEGAMFPRMALVIVLSSVLGMLLGGGMFLLARFLSKGGVGMGDVKLFAVIGSYVGSGSIMAVTFLTIVISAAYSIVMLAVKKVRWKEEIPFAPFIWIGTMLAMALGM